MIDIFKKKKTVQQTEVEKLKSELEKCRFLMARNEAHFNMTGDDDLLISQIYERESLRYQYNYLLNQLREKKTAI